MYKGSILLSGLLFLLLFPFYHYHHVDALSYGTTCDTAVDLTTTFGVGAGFAGFLESPFDKSWYRSTLSTSCTANSVNTLISSQQWVWYSINTGTESYLIISTMDSMGADTGSADTILFLTNNVCSSTSTPSFCSNDYSLSTKKSEIVTGPINSRYNIAIGQYASSSTNGVTYLTGKTNLRRFCIHSCSICSGSPAKLFYPNSAAEYTYLTGVTSTNSCGDIYNLNYYTFTAPSAGSVLISTCPTDGATKTHSLNTKIAVFTTCSSNHIQCVTGSSSSGSCSNSARVTFAVTQGITYIVTLGSTTSASYDGFGKPIFIFTCATGTYDDDNNQNTACVTCTPKLNCASLTCTTSNDSVCTSCNSGSYLSGGSCLPCSSLPNCNTTTCSTASNSVCTACNNGYYFFTASCLACTSVANCAIVTCASGSMSICTVCNDGYYINGGSCSTCSPKSNCNIVSCSSSSNSVCTACKLGFYIDGTGSCSTCPPVANCTNTVCTTATNSVCTSCKSGTYLNNGLCTPCTPVPNCNSDLTCSTASNSVCTSCRSGFYLKNSACSPCVPKTNCAAVTCTDGVSSACTLCNDGFYLEGDSCSTCLIKPNCATVTCTNPFSSICTQCNSGFYLNGDSCLPCLPKTKCSTVTCSDGFTSICTFCEVGYILGEGVCTLLCADGTYLSSDGLSCIDCSPVNNCIGAVTCTNSADSVCSLCSSGSYLRNGFCFACTSKTNCTSVTCSSSTDSVCTACQSGSYLHGGSCLTCLAKSNCNTVTCLEGTSSTCTACNSGYYVNSGSCSTCSAKPNCNTVTCSDGLSSTCTACNNGYYLNSGSCSPCTPVPNCNSALTCSTSSNSVCTSCISGFYLNNGACAACTTVPNCNSDLTCSTSSNSICTSCNSGYYLDSGSCTACSPIPNCNSDLTCSSPSNSVCTSCVGGTYLSSPSLCSDCLAKPNCTSVSCSNGTVSTCTVCNEGYTLSNGNCILDSINNNNNNDNEGASSSPSAAIVGAIVGILGLVLIIVVFVVLKRRKNPLKLKMRSSPSSELFENIIPLTHVSIPSNLELTPSTSTSKLYEIPSTSQAENEYASPLHHSARIYDYITPYAKQVLPHPSIEKDIVIDGVIGNGSFGVVKLGRIPNSRVPPYCKDLISKDREDTHLLCAAKTLRENSDEKSKRDFADEGRMMANFNHPNVIRMVAVLLDARPPMLVTEFMKYGDLKGVLIKSETKSFVWYEKEFLFVSLQIAQGMEYLQSINFIHRDLAARNCLVSDGLTVKISDFGLSKELAGEKDYYTLQTKGRLPVKWMAPESIGYRRFTHASDVWSFGVTMWEVFSYAHSPYGNIRAPDILAFIESGEQLECPSTCFSMPIVYEWMLKCWEFNPNNRPTFNESIQFLSTQMSSPKLTSQEIRNIGELL